MRKRRKIYYTIESGLWWDMKGRKWSDGLPPSPFCNLAHARTMKRAYQIGHSAAMLNKKLGKNNPVIIIRSYKHKGKRWCREFIHKVI